MFIWVRCTQPNSSVRVTRSFFLRLKKEKKDSDRAVLNAHKYSEYALRLCLRLTACPPTAKLHGHGMRL